MEKVGGSFRCFPKSFRSGSSAFKKVAAPRFFPFLRAGCMAARISERLRSIGRANWYPNQGTVVVDDVFLFVRPGHGWRGGCSRCGTTRRFVTSSPLHERLVLVSRADSFFPLPFSSLSARFLPSFLPARLPLPSHRLPLVCPVFHDLSPRQFPYQRNAASRIPKSFEPAAVSHLF